VTLAGFFPPVLALALTAYVLGRTATRRFVFAGRGERVAVSSALGLALAAHLLLLLGFAKLLRPWPVLLLAVLIHAAGVPAWREIWGDLRRASQLPRWVWPAALVLLAPLVLLALYPPTAFDATMYHLPFARAFAGTGGVPYLADRRFPVFPQAGEILFAAAMLFGRDVAAHGIQLVSTVLAAALTVLWGREVFPFWPPAGWLAGALLLGGPIVVHLATTAYVEAGLMLFATASLYALDRWRRSGGREWLVLAALFGATAADVKYLGLFFVGAAGLTVVLAGGGRRSPAARLRDGLLFAAVAAAVLAPWYLRIYLHTGNPLFPFLPQVFGGKPWESLPHRVIFDPLPWRLLRWLRLPWDVTFARRLYNQQPPFSPVYLAALPLLIYGAMRDARVRWLLAVASLYALGFTWLPADSRYLLPVLPLLGLAVAGSLAVLDRPVLQGRAAALALCLSCLVPGWLYAVYRVARQGPPPVTVEARDTYLAARLPLYPALAWLNRTRGDAYTVWAFHAENMVYFADGGFLGDWSGLASYARVLAGPPDADSLHRRLRELGATHLLVPTGAVLSGLDDAALRRRFELVYQDAAARIYALDGSHRTLPP
jgi:4-amino-4-deoxy-L-arabinose transferase-like glycosyltransferase